MARDTIAIDATLLSLILVTLPRQFYCCLCAFRSYAAQYHSAAYAAYAYAGYYAIACYAMPPFYAFSLFSLAAAAAIMLLPCHAYAMLPFRCLR